MNQPAASTRQLVKRAHNAMQKQDGGAALTLWKDVLALNPYHAEALYNIGYILHCVGRADEARDYYQRSIQADEHYLESYLMLSKLLEEQSLGDQAIQISHLAAQMAPDNSKAHHELAGQLIRFNKAHLAVAYLDQIIAKFPKDANLLQVYCMALKINERYEEADKAYAKLTSEFHMRFSARILYETYLPRLYASNEDIERTRAKFKASLEQFIARKVPINIDEFKFQPVFQLAFHNRDNKELVQLFVKALRIMAPVLNYVAPHCRKPYVKHEGKIRIGFISRHMHNHSVGNCYRNVMITLARHPDFEVTLFNPDNVVDEKTQEIIAANIPIVYLPKTVAGSHAVIAPYEFDIIIYPDIGMDSANYYLAMARMAPYQLCFQGHPETTGIDTIDYVVSSRSYEPPHADENYTERLLCNEGIDTIFKRPNSPDRWLTRAETGLPEGKKLYICPMAIQKFHPDFDDVLADILAADANAVIVLFNDFHQATTSTFLQERILKKCPRERVIFMPWLSTAGLFSVMKLADALLDTIYFGGGTTSQYAFHFGLPIVTWPGHYARGRVVYSYYSVMGVPDAPIAGSAKEYVALAVKLANDKDYAKKVSDEILARNVAMFEAAPHGPQVVQLMHDIIDQNLDKYNRNPA